MAGTISAKVSVTDGGQLGVQVVRAAVGQVHFAVNDVGVRAGGGAVKRPLELAEGDGQAGQGDVALGARIAQPLGLAGQVGGHGRQQVRLVELEGLAQLKPEGASGRSAPGRPSWKTAVGWP